MYFERVWLKNQPFSREDGRPPVNLDQLGSFQLVLRSVLVVHLDGLHVVHLFVICQVRVDQMQELQNQTVHERPAQFEQKSEKVTLLSAHEVYCLLDRQVVARQRNEPLDEVHLVRDACIFEFSTKIREVTQQLLLELFGVVFHSRQT